MQASATAGGKLQYLQPLTVKTQANAAKIKQ
jgi:hypothetical protein